MAGRRLLDAARLFSATGAVARQHFALRLQQWDAYTQTSTLARAVKHQTDRVTVTAGAAIALAKRFSESDLPQRTAHEETIQRQEPVQGRGKVSRQEEGLGQDHHYGRSERNAAVESPPQDDLEVTQEQAERYPLPDGTIPPQGTRLGTTPGRQGQDTYAGRPTAETTKEPLEQHSADSDLDVTQKKPDEYPMRDGTIPPHDSPIGTSPSRNGSDIHGGRPSPESASGLLVDRGIEPKESGASTIPLPSSHASDAANAARKSQRQSEFQIPSMSAKSSSAVTDRQYSGRDTFAIRSEDASPDLSSLPRFKIPKHTGDTQGTDRHVEEGQMHQDVYYSSGPSTQKAPIPSREAVPEQEEGTTQGINTDIFHSPRIASMISGSGRDKRRNAYEMKMKAARRTPVEHSRLQDGKDQDTFNVRQSSDSLPEPLQGRSQDSEDEVRRFAESLAQDATGAPPFLAESPTEADNQSSSTPYQMRESSVPSSRFGRLWQYGGLATSMAFGAVGESLRRVTGSGTSGGSLMLSEANMERLVAKLSRMRGAALKLGQMMSFQDSKLLPPTINAVLQRVQDSADYMPPSQRNKVLISNLGNDWRDLFSTFEEVPMAAASIGQVHKAVMASTGKAVAVKIQYPGVRNSIDSDLNNLTLLLTASRLLPKGLYLDKTIANARTELGWECDYIREAECGQRFRELLRDETDVFTVPELIPEACGREVLTAELMAGTGVTKVKDLSQDERDWIGTQILRLCLRELMEWGFMQTDPNWTNFLFNRAASGGQRKIELLDFGASREFPETFTTPYIRLLMAAAVHDRNACRDLSIQLGYLTGRESKAMLEAHVDSVLTLAEPFLESADLDSEGRYDFRDQTITDRVREKIGVMVRERLAPPPEETYSLHRKLSGAFLLCAKLGSRVPTRDMFVRAVARWEGKRMGKAA